MVWAGLGRSLDTLARLASSWAGFNQNQKQQKDPAMPEEEDRFPPSWHKKNKDPVFV